MEVMEKKLCGLYLVVDMTVAEEKLLPTLEQALDGGVDILQLWGKKQDGSSASSIASRILSLAREYTALCLVADDLELCKTIGANGVHFDGYPYPPITPGEAKRQLGSGAIVGVTCGNSVEKLRWAEENGADYVSFCSIFPTSSVDSCEIVPLEMVRTAKKILTIPVFASGGITLENVDDVLNAGADGIAVVSAILKAVNPKAAAAAFKKKLQHFESIDGHR
jgi:thiamine-phosphate pyrophosphorylase